MESNVVTEVYDEGVYSVRIFCPLNVRGTFDFGTVSVNFLLWFCATFLWWHDGVGVRKKILRP